MHVQSASERARIDRRLSRAEGQVRGVRRMLDEDRDCREIVQQLSAARSAIHQAGLDVMKVYAAQCLREGTDENSQNTDNEEMIDYIVGALGKWG